MPEHDLFNLKIIDADHNVDHVNKKFYERYNYPWPPSFVPQYPPLAATAFLNQDVGSWDHSRLPRNMKIWVAGCGTNQALCTALRFPEATVLGTDISARSLDVCRSNAAQIGVTNLVLEEKSLNDIDYQEEFDHIICTGVVHHNAYPEATLQRIAAALKKDGVLEFMMYNYYHRLLSTASQNAVREFYDVNGGIDMGMELSLIKKLMFGFQQGNVMGEFLGTHVHCHEAEMADRLLQPVEYSYTITSLKNLLDSCNLEYLSQAVNHHDKGNPQISWNMNFNNRELQAAYDKLPDEKRWQITNLLLFNESPMLWFYLQRKDAGIGSQSEQLMAEEFLDTRFRKNVFPVKHYVLDNDGEYVLSGEQITYPAPAQPAHPLAGKVFAAAHPGLTMREIFTRLNIKPTFNNVNEARLRLTTSAFPYLLSVTG